MNVEPTPRPHGTMDTGRSGGWFDAFARELLSVTLRLTDQAPRGYRCDTAAWRSAGIWVEVAFVLQSPRTLHAALVDLEHRVTSEDFVSHKLLDSVAELDDWERLDWQPPT